MAQALLEPEPDTRPEWQKIYDYMKATGLDFGRIYSYTQIRGIIGRDIRKNRPPIRQVIDALELNDHRTLQARRGIGYRIVEPTEHLFLANSRRNRADRQIVLAQKTLRATDLDKLDPEIRKIADAMDKGFTQMAMYIRHNEERAQRHEEALRKAGLLPD